MGFEGTANSETPGTEEDSGFEGGVWVPRRAIKRAPLELLLGFGDEGRCGDEEGD